MSGNTFGRILTITTFGESHGPAIGAVLDGVESGFSIDIAEIQKMLDRRKPGGDNISSPRKESDEVRILSGVFNGKTTGTPICLILDNKDAKEPENDILKTIARPGHADLPYAVRYSNRDYRSGGRASGRETAARVAAGAIAVQILRSKGIEIICKVCSIGGVNGSESNPDDMISWRSLIDMYAAKGETVGGSVRCEATSVPIGMGEPVFDKLEALLSHAVMSIPAIKGIEFGSGFKSEFLSGSASNMKGNSGGVLGGLSDGQRLSFRAAVKAVPTVDVPQTGINLETMKEEVFTYQARHDRCICFRICPVVEAMTALVLLDCWYSRYGR